MNNYTDENRGKIQNIAKKQQIIDYSGLRMDKITPTDIDGFTEFYGVSGFEEIHDELYMFFEFKTGDSDLPYGQKMALLRLVNAIKDREVLLIIANHNHPDDEQIDAANAIVREYYYKAKDDNECKKYDGKGRTVLNLRDSFLEHAKKTA